ncbi:MAG: metal-dependent hydrolase [Cyclobacteriaceae bacterium]|jgi:inner membrane protein|nr:metal-dependent hydrolase [Cyclobacteriaceae bacterium]
MDSITHVVLGAVIGEALAGKKLGKKAMLFGAIAQSLPDIDFVASFWLSFSANLIAHRGITHSFFFVIIASVPIALALSRWYTKAEMSFKSWYIFWVVQMSVHLLIDACNAYGTGWFEPFSSLRVAFHFLFVADPFYTVWLLIATVALFVLRRDHPARIKWVVASLALSSLYIIYAYSNRYAIEEDVNNSLKRNNIIYQRVLITPTPLNTWLWFVAVEADDGFYISHRATADHNREVPNYFFPQNAQVLDTLRDRETLNHLLRFSEGYYIVEERDDKLIFSDLRFGQITGWATPKEKFVFHYYLNHPEDNLLVIQRGRFANWNKETVGEMIRRIRGK